MMDFIAVRYLFFAIIATCLNIAIQYLCVRLYQGNGSFLLSIMFGTLAGLVVKYLLDKKYIFRHTSSTRSEEGKNFAIYTFMGIFTTLIYLAFEIGFDYVFQNLVMRYLGAVLGLGLGYWLKYHLDKRFVFVDRSEIRSANAT